MSIKSLNDSLEEEYDDVSESDPEAFCESERFTEGGKKNVESRLINDINDNIDDDFTEVTFIGNKFGAVEGLQNERLVMDEADKKEAEEKRMEAEKAAAEHQALRKQQGVLDALVLLQQPEGCFEGNQSFLDAINHLLKDTVVSSLQNELQANKDKTFWTAVALVFMETFLKELEDEWRMVHNKAQQWLSQSSEDEAYNAAKAILSA